MKILETIYLKLFSKSSDTIITKDGHFEFKPPEGFRYRYSKGIYQVFHPQDKSFLFQWSTNVLQNKAENMFNVNWELENEKIEHPNAEIQSTGQYKSICSATTNEYQSVTIYTWKIGKSNKRILVTLILNGQLNRELINQKVLLAGQLMATFKINGKR